MLFGAQKVLFYTGSNTTQIDYSLVSEESCGHGKETHYEKSNKELDTRDGERFIYRLAKYCRPQAEDVEKFRKINDQHGKLLVDYRKVMERLHECVEKVSNEEFTHLPIPQLPPTHGPVHSITVQEKQAALIQMKSGKATSPDDVAVELWKSGCWSFAACLTKVFNWVVVEKNGNEARRFRFGRAKAAPLNA
ncbi:hypothetical protein Y032_0476g2146 [Ancylostoma ceylanicum]|uniref:Uncharacterized protein n=2 Tax=Ancylostoma ceylanicum TaxID=53326 RepID=A0A016WXH0_9BILA|nr:hypothetical protein Y032_0476g2146 [Ancylostoma ceylanicum]